MQRANQLAMLVFGSALAASAQSSRWDSLAEVKSGVTIIVETTNRYGPPSYDRCRMAGADGANLTCVEGRGQGTRLVFPAAQVESVSQVVRPFPVGVIFVLASVGLLAGGIASGNLTALKLGLIGGFASLLIAGANPQARWKDPFGRLPAPGERLRLVYRRVAPPPDPRPPEPEPAPIPPWSSSASLVARQP